MPNLVKKNVNIKTQYFADEVLKYQITFTEKKSHVVAEKYHVSKGMWKKNWNEVIKTFIVGILYFYGIHIKFPIFVFESRWFRPLR